MNFNFVLAFVARFCDLLASRYNNISSKTKFAEYAGMSAVNSQQSTLAINFRLGHGRSITPQIRAASLWSGAGSGLRNI